MQQAVEQIQTNIDNLGKLKAAGYNVGSLNWKAPHEYRSFTYRQRGFEPDEKTGAWYACFNVEQDTSEKPNPEDIDTTDTVGIDLGITSFIYDSDGRTIDRLDFSADRDRLEREQRNLSRKQYGSNNWEKRRRQVAEVHQQMRNKKQDFKHKLAAFYTSEYDAVFVENLNVKSMLEGERKGRNTHEVGWRDFITILKHHGKKRDCHVVEVPPEGTTKECASCSVASDKPLWVCEHSCPACGYTADRDYNAALNVWQRGLEKLGVVHSEGTPVETALPTDTEAKAVDVSAKRVVETGSPCQGAAEGGE